MFLNNCLSHYLFLRRIVYPSIKCLLFFFFFEIIILKKMVDKYTVQLRGNYYSYLNYPFKLKN